MLLPITPKNQPYYQPIKGAENLTPQQKFETHLNEALRCEQQGYTEQARGMFSDLFWNPEHTPEHKDNLESVVLKLPEHGSRHIAILKMCGSEVANFLYGKLLLENNDNKWAEKNYGEAIKYFTLAAQKGYQPALTILLQRAEKDCPIANYELGSLYAAGKGVAANEDKAIAYFNMAVKSEPKKANLELAHLYLGKRDTTNYVKYLQDAIKAGSNDAKAELTEFEKITFKDAEMLWGLREGIKNFGNESKAIKMYELSASLGNRNAMFKLYEIHHARTEESIFSGNSPALAKQYLDNAADAGHISAKNIRTGKQIKETKIEKDEILKADKEFKEKILAKSSKPAQNLININGNDSSEKPQSWSFSSFFSRTPEVKNNVDEKK